MRWEYGPNAWIQLMLRLPVCGKHTSRPTCRLGKAIFRSFVEIDPEDRGSCFSQRPKVPHISPVRPIGWMHMWLVFASMSVIKTFAVCFVLAKVRNRIWNLFLNFSGSKHACAPIRSIMPLPYFRYWVFTSIQFILWKSNTIEFTWHPGGHSNIVELRICINKNVEKGSDFGHWALMTFRGWFLTIST